MDVKDDCFKYKSYFFNFLIILGCKNKDFVQLSGNGLNSNAEIWLYFILLDYLPIPFAIIICMVIILTVVIV